MSIFVTPNPDKPEPRSISQRRQERQGENKTFAPLYTRRIADSAGRSKRLRELHDLAVKWGTVTNTLMDGIAPRGTMLVESPYSANTLSPKAHTS